MLPPSLTHHKPQEPELPVLKRLPHASPRCGLHLSVVPAGLGGGRGSPNAQGADGGHDTVDEGELAEHDREVGVNFVGVDSTDSVQALRVDDGRTHLRSN